METYSVSVFPVLLFIYTCLPFRFWKTFSFSSQIEPLMIITTLSLACCIFMLIGQIRKSNVSILITWLDVILFAYLLYLLSQLLFYPVDREYIYKIICLTTVYYVFRRIPLQLIIALFCLLPVLVIVQIIYGYNQLTEPWQRLSDITGIFYNTGIFGGLVALGLVTGLGLMFRIKPQKYYIDKILLGIILILLITQLIFSQSRAAWLAAVVGTIVLLFPVFRKLTKTNVVILISVLLILGILSSAKLYYFKKDSADGRLLIWAVSWNLFKEKPLTGFGPDGFRKNYMLRQGNYLKEHPGSPWADLADDTTSSFNEFLKTGIEQGTIGLLFVSGIIFLVITARKARKEQAILSTLMIFSCFSYPFSFIQFQILLMICLASIANGQEPIISLSLKPKSGEEKIQKTAVGIAIFLFCLTSGSLYNYASMIKRWNKAYSNVYNNKEKSLNEFKSLCPAMKYNALFMTTYGWKLYLSGQYKDAANYFEKAIVLNPSANTLIRLGRACEKTGEYDKAFEAYQTASYMIPVLFEPRCEMAKLLFKQEKHNESKQKAKEILTKKIKIDHPKIDRMKEEMQMILNFDSMINRTNGVY